MRMDYADAVDLYVGINSLLNEYWNFYSAAVLGIVAVVFGVEKIRNDARIKGVVTAAFVVFSLGNLIQILKHQETLFRIVQSLMAASPEEGMAPEFASVVQTFHASSVGGVAGFHLILDFLVLVGIWTPEIIRRLRRAG